MSHVKHQRLHFCSTSELCKILIANTSFHKGHIALTQRSS